MPPPFPSTTFHAQRSYSSIANEMLGRAKQTYESTTAAKNDLAKQLFSSSPPQDGNIQEQFRKVRQSSQSIGGFTGYTNSSKDLNSLRPKSPNIKTGLKRKSDSFSTAPSTFGLPSVLNRADSFQNSPNTVYLTQNTSKASTQSHPAVDFDENDFEDDDLLDIDQDYVIPPATSMAAPPRPASQKIVNVSQSPLLPQQRPLSRPQDFHHPSSSAMTWSSSPLSHKEPPQASLSLQQPQEVIDLEATALEITEPNCRAGKRRTLPWAQKKAEEDEIAARNEDRAELLASLATSAFCHSSKCSRCSKEGHSADDCPRVKGNGTAHDYTPLPKDKKMPWNNTSSAIKEQRNFFKEKKRAAKKSIDATQVAAMEQHSRQKKAVLAPISLSDEQKRVQDLVCNQKKSVFFTGSAGTGKSVLMRSIIAELRKQYIRDPDRVAVTASTGLAACNIGGVTLHSFGGIGLGKEDVPTLVKKIKRNAKAKNRWIKTKVLIIDEISMVDGDLFDKLEGIARAMRNNGRPFGGIQLVVTGDFFQLPPVPDFENKARGAKFAFDAGTWSTAIHHTIGLTEVFRQKDPVFANMLNEMRLGKITNETIMAFKKLNRTPAFEDGLTATELFPTRNEVDNSNAFRMRDLVGKIYRYEATDTGTIQDVVQRDRLLSNMMAPKVLELKKGAQVMLIKNMDDGLVNGSLGIITSFMSEATFDIYDNHPEFFGEGGDGEDLSEEALEMRNSIKQRFSSKNKDPKPDTGKIYPLVQFKIADGTTRDLLVQPEEWKVELPSGEVQAQRSQLPLILAWALSIHKAQGQTLERVKIDLKKVFEKGQAYVALSRATSQAGLEVLNFDPAKVMAHPRVAQFYDSLYSVNKALQHPKIAKSAASKPVSSNKSRYFEQSGGYEVDAEEEAIATAAYG